MTEPNSEGVATKGAAETLRRRVGLLVSVRNAAEAAVAFAAGADVIDIKEPSRGPLGAADDDTIAEVIALVAGRVPVTAALGDLHEEPTVGSLPGGLAVAKIGLAGGDAAGWRGQLRRFTASLPATIQPAVAAYADHERARSPEPAAVLAAAIDEGLPWMVLDTWDKSGGGLFDAMHDQDVQRWLDRAAAAGVRVVLAGGLSGEAFDHALAMRPTLVGVRGAACVGGRGGVVDHTRVRSLVHSVREAGLTRGSAVPSSRCTLRDTTDAEV